MHAWNRQNPGFEQDLPYWQDKLKKAEAEGYISEVCECGAVFLAFHHFTTCRDKNCPFSDGVSLLDRWADQGAPPCPTDDKCPECKTDLSVHPLTGQRRCNTCDIEFSLLRKDDSDSDNPG